MARRICYFSFVDSNGNKKLDKNFFGIPKEQYGFSNNVGDVATNFDQAKFLIEGPTTQNIENWHS